MLRNTLAALVLLFASLFADAAPVTLAWVNPAAWSDGSPLAQSEIRFANVYCRTAAGPYTTLVSVPVTAAQATIDATRRATCALALVATKTDASGYRESDLSPEFVVDPIATNAPTSITVQTSAPATCTTTCTVSRSR